MDVPWVGDHKLKDVGRSPDERLLRWSDESKTPEHPKSNWSMENLRKPRSTEAGQGDEAATLVAASAINMKTHVADAALI